MRSWAPVPAAVEARKDEPRAARPGRDVRVFACRDTGEVDAPSANGQGARAVSRCQWRRQANSARRAAGFALALHVLQGRRRVRKYQSTGPCSTTRARAAAARGGRPAAACEGKGSDGLPVCRGSGRALEECTRCDGTAKSRREVQEDGGNGARRGDKAGDGVPTARRDRLRASERARPSPRRGRERTRGKYLRSLQAAFAAHKDSRICFAKHMQSEELPGSARR